MWTSEERKSVQGKHGLITRWMSWKVGKFQHDGTRAEMAESYGQRKKKRHTIWKWEEKSDRRQMNKVNVLCCRQKSFIKDNSRKGGEEWKKEKKMRMQSKMGQEKDYETALQKWRESVLKCWWGTEEENDKKLQGGDINTGLELQWMRWKAR